MKKILAFTLAVSFALPHTMLGARIQEQEFKGKHAWLQGFKGVPKWTAMCGSASGIGLGAFIGLVAILNFERGTTWNARFVEGATVGGVSGAIFGSVFGALYGYSKAYGDSPHYSFNVVKKYVDKIRNQRLYPFMYDSSITSVESAEQLFVNSSYPLAKSAAQWGAESAEWQEFHHRLAEIAYTFNAEEDQVEALALLGVSGEFLPILIEAVRAIKADPRFIDQQRLFLETMQAQSAMMTAHAEQMQANAAWVEAINSFMR